MLSQHCLLMPVFVRCDLGTRSGEAPTGKHMHSTREWRTDGKPLPWCAPSLPHESLFFSPSFLVLLRSSLYACGVNLSSSCQLLCFITCGVNPLLTFLLLEGVFAWVGFKCLNRIDSFVRAPFGFHGEQAYSPRLMYTWVIRGCGYAVDGSLRFFVSR